MTDANKASPERIGRVTPAQWKICKYIWILLARAFDRCWSRQFTERVHDYSSAVSVPSRKRVIKIPSSIAGMTPLAKAILIERACISVLQTATGYTFPNRSQFNLFKIRSETFAIKAQQPQLLRCTDNYVTYTISKCIEWIRSSRVCRCFVAKWWYQDHRNSEWAQLLCAQLTSNIISRYTRCHLDRDAIKKMYLWIHFSSSYTYVRKVKALFIFHIRLKIIIS